MKTPPLMIGLSLIFWGYVGQLLPLAVIMALIIEGARLIPMRWNLSDKDFNRISSLSTLVLIVVTLYLSLSHQSRYFVAEIIKYLPLIFFPLLTFQTYSVSNSIDVRTLFLFIKKKIGGRQSINMNLSYPYIVICLVSASAANVRTLWFYGGLCLIAGWALWSVRSQRFSLFWFGFLFALAAAAGYGGHNGLSTLQKIVDHKLYTWYFGISEKETNPFKSSTALGDVGTMKFSNEIVLRIESSSKAIPFLLRTASYNVFYRKTWKAVDSPFHSLTSESNGTTWKLGEPLSGEKIMTISTYLKDGKGVLPLPGEAAQIENLPVAAVKINTLGAVKVDKGPGLIAYTVRTGYSSSLNSPPDTHDFLIPSKEDPALSNILETLHLNHQSPDEILKTINSFFQNNFTYSLTQEKVKPGTTPIENFLLHSRSGHCEFFAAATVLLLRKAGIAARYSTGYSVQEFSFLENKFIARQRHAHAWALVHRDGKWHDFDTTPPAWFATEQENTSMFQTLGDLWSYIKYGVINWRGKSDQNDYIRHIIWLIIPLFIILMWRLFYKKEVTLLRKRKVEKHIHTSLKGSDSEFILIVDKLHESGYKRHISESILDWIKRLEQTTSLPIESQELHKIINLHYRYRFDPHGLSNEERAELNKRVQSCLKKIDHRDDKLNSS